MTDSDKRAFALSFNRLAVACRLPADEGDRAMKLIYFQGLQDFSVEVVTSAALALEQKATFFPKVAEWRSQARIAEVATLRALTDGRETPWSDECGACLDTGWEERRCYPGTPDNCGRRKCLSGHVERSEHTYMQVCSCRPGNRTYQRHHMGTAANYAIDNA